MCLGLAVEPQWEVCDIVALRSDKGKPCWVHGWPTADFHKYARHAMQPDTGAPEVEQAVQAPALDQNALIQCRVRMRQEAKTQSGASAYRLHFVPADRPQKLCEAGLQTQRLKCGQVAVGRRDNVLISQDLVLVSIQQFTHQVLKDNETCGRWMLYATVPLCAWSRNKHITIDDCDDFVYRRHEGVTSQTLEVCNAFMRFMLLHVRSNSKAHTKVVMDELWKYMGHCRDETIDVLAWADIVMSNPCGVFARKVCRFFQSKRLETHGYTWLQTGGGKVSQLYKEAAAKWAAWQYDGEGGPVFDWNCAELRSWMPLDVLCGCASKENQCRAIVTSLSECYRCTAVSVVVVTSGLPQLVFDDLHSTWQTVLSSSTHVCTVAAFCGMTQEAVQSSCIAIILFGMSTWELLCVLKTVMKRKLHYSSVYVVGCRHAVNFGMSENSWTGCVESLWRARHGKGMSRRFDVSSIDLQSCFRCTEDLTKYIPRATMVWSMDMAGEHLPKALAKGDTVFVKGITTTGQVLFRHFVPAKVKTALSVVHNKCGSDMSYVRLQQNVRLVHYCSPLNAPEMQPDNALRAHVHSSQQQEGWVYERLLHGGPYSPSDMSLLPARGSLPSSCVFPSTRLPLLLDGNCEPLRWRKEIVSAMLVASGPILVTNNFFTKLQKVWTQVVEDSKLATAC